MKFLTKIILTVLFLGVTLFAKDVATITAINGEAFVERDGVKSALILGYKLQEKDTVLTSDKSKVQIIFSDETVVTVGKKSNFSINEYLFEDGNEPVAKFGMLKGAMRTITGKIGKIAPDKFSVKTKTATIGIRGTNFTILEGDDGSQRVYCTFGAISVTVNGQEVIVEQGFYVYISPDGKVEVKEFSPKELRGAQKDGFGEAQAKKGNANTDDDVAQNSGQIDTTKDDGNSIVVKDVTDTTQDAVQITEKTPKPTPKPAPKPAPSPSPSPAPAPAPAPAPETPVARTVFGYAIVNDSDYINSDLTLELKTKTDGSYILTSGELVFDVAQYTIKPTTVYSTSLDTEFTDVQIEGDHRTIGAMNDFISIANTSTLADEDYISWGSWEVEYSDGGSGTIQDKGYWVSGIPTEDAVVAAETRLFRYTGDYKAYEYTNNGSAVVSSAVEGTVTLDVDFGNDHATLTIEDNAVTNGYNWAKFEEDVEIATSKFTINQTEYKEQSITTTPGTSTGKFYGTNAQAVGGEFTITNGSDVKGQGVYQVGGRVEQ